MHRKLLKDILNEKWRWRGGYNMNKRTMFILLTVLIIFLLAVCKQSRKINLLLPPKKGEKVIFETSELIYQNDTSTAYSIGEVGSIFVFSNDMLSINSNEEIKMYKTSYNKKTITIEDFKNQLQVGEDLPEIHSYKNITQYDLCQSTDDLPGYRLYVLDDQYYWIGTLYKGVIWRIISVNISK